MTNRKRKHSTPPKEYPTKRTRNTLHERQSDCEEEHDHQNDFQEMKHLLQKLCKKVERNEKHLKEIQKGQR